MSASANSAGDVKQAIETFDELCTHVEHTLGVKIPKYLQNILLYSGFDNRVSLRSLGESDISYLETFLRSDDYYNLVASSQVGSMEEFYGIVYKFDRKRFAIPLGHKRLLIHIGACLRENPKIVKTPKKVKVGSIIIPDLC